MVSIPCAVYRSMIRISKKYDSELVNHLQYGLSTFKDSKTQLYDYKYIRDEKTFFIYGPYTNETANMLSYTKCLIRDGKNTDYKMERLFLAHRELPEFFIAKKNLEKQDKLRLLKEKQVVKNNKINKINKLRKVSDLIPEDSAKPKPTSFGTGFY